MVRFRADSCEVARAPIWVSASSAMSLAVMACSWAADSPLTCVLLSTATWVSTSADTAALLRFLIWSALSALTWVVVSSPMSVVVRFFS